MEKAGCGVSCIQHPWSTGQDATRLLQKYFCFLPLKSQADSDFALLHALSSFPAFGSW
jgi:hypothetical protein